MIKSRATYSNPEYPSDSAGSSLIKEFYPIGFKQTDCGAIPLDWHVFSLQNLCRVPITYGIVQCGPHIEGGVPYIRVSDMNSNELDISNMLRTTPAIAASFSRSRVEDGDIVYALRGLLGTVKIVRDDVVGANLTQGTARIAPGNNIYNNYLYWALRSEGVLKQATKEAKGSTFIEITLANLKEIKIPVPEIVEEQTAIANALSDVDALIQELEKLIAKKQAIKTATMQQLLTGRTRLPQFAHHPDGRKKGYKPSELGEIPEDWEVYLFGDVTDSCSSGGTPFRGNKSYYSGTNRWITSGELNYCVINDTIEKISDEAIKKSNLKVHPVGTFLMAITGLEAAGTRGACGIVGAPAATNQSCMAIYPNEKLLSTYLYYWYVYNGQELAFKYCQGTKQLSYTAGLLKTIPINLPTSQDEQSAISAILYDMDSEINSLNQRLFKTRHIKQGMMQELLTGKTRLVKPAGAA